MVTACKHCGAATTFDDGVAVCTGCGSLVDPTTYVLDNDSYESSIQYDTWAPLAPKALKTGHNHYISGHGKEARDNKNLDDMRWFIKSLASAVFASGTADRAYNLFQQAMASGQYRWGRMARLVAAASISIALRETSRPEMFPDLAALLGQRVPFLTRAFSSVIATLKLALPSSESKSHVSTLQAHLSQVLDGSLASDLPAFLVAVLKPLPANVILATALSLSDLLTSADPPSAVARLPASPTACAVLLLAIEAETRTALAHLGDLATFLGAKCSVKKGVVMGRYKAIQDELIMRIAQLDWLDKYEPNSGKKGRAKVPRRTVVARGLKDVIEHERACRRQHLDQLSQPAASNDDDTTARPRKRRKTHAAVHHATYFLLNPLSGPLPASFTPGPSRGLPLPTYLLAAPPDLRRLPSRLQLLAAARGGGADAIDDTELFGDGELERLLRPASEVEELRAVFGWDADAEGDAEVRARPPPTPRRRRAEKKTTSERLVPEAVACFFADKTDEDLHELLAFGPDADAEDPTFVVEPDDGMGVFAGVRRALLPGEEGGHDGDDDDDSRCSSPEPDDRYAQECD